MDPAGKRTQAEGILNRAKAGEDFAALAKEFSTDPGSKDKGGLYENIRLGQMVKPFEEAAMSVEPGQVVPNLVETDFGYHIIKLEGKNEVKEGDATAQTYSARHILISTGVKDPENPMSREVPVKQYARAKLEEEKQKKLMDDIVAGNHVEVPADFDVPEVSEAQMEEMMKKQQEQMQQLQMPEGAEDEEAPAADTKKPAAPKKK
jgi:parvulin-like peptidyl-prolyl isomerase